MGTNYYLKTNICPHCKRSDHQRHIGKSSAGWCFALHVIPEDKINDLPGWQTEWSQMESSIVNEYGSSLTAHEMLEIIVDRRGMERRPDYIPTLYKSWTDFHLENCSEPGPNNLVRSKIDGHHCVGHGSGTWDLITGEFS